MKWYKSAIKPETYNSVLGLTEDLLMIEVYWNGKRWVSSLTGLDTELSINYWRKIPKLPDVKNIVHKKARKVSAKPTYTQKMYEFRQLRRVIFDQLTGKMKSV